MSSMNRTLRGDVLIYRHDATERMIDAGLLAQHGRSGRTLVKSGPMRVVITALAPGGELPLHGTTGPRTIQIVSGAIVCTVRGREVRLKAGDVIALGPGVKHSAVSPEGAVLLLTLVHRRHHERSGARDTKGRNIGRSSPARGEAADEGWEDVGRS